MVTNPKGDHPGGTNHQSIVIYKPGDYRRLFGVLFILWHSDMLLSIVEKALKRDPEKRYQAAKDMLRDLETMKIRDKRYKKLSIFQMIYNGAFIALLATGILLALKGTSIRNTEDFDLAYVDLVETAESDEYDKTIADAIDLLNNGKYSRILDERSEEKADLLYMIANAYFENDDYENAIPFYEETVDTADNNPGYYRDYAIAYARIGRTDRAAAILDEGIKKGLSGADLYLANAEIESRNGDHNSAIEDFQKAIETSSDSNVTGRAYILYSRDVRKQGDLKEARRILEEAYDVSDDRWKLRILREMGSVAIQYITENGQEPDWLKTAETCYRTLTNSDRYKLNDWLNYALLLKMQGNDSDAASALEETKRLYPDEYRVPLRQAFMEIELQAGYNKEKRDYTMADKYYREAEKLYDKYRNSGDSDDEMLDLEEIMQELKEKGWL